MPQFQSDSEIGKSALFQKSEELSSKTLEQYSKDMNHMPFSRFPKQKLSSLYKSSDLLLQTTQDSTPLESKIRGDLDHQKCILEEELSEISLKSSCSEGLVSSQISTEKDDGSASDADLNE